MPFQVYGFIGWALTFAAWVCYILWAFLPDSVLVGDDLVERVSLSPNLLLEINSPVQKGIGVHWYPAKYWAVAAPAFLVFIVSSYGAVYGAIGEPAGMALGIPAPVVSVTT